MLCFQSVLYCIVLYNDVFTFLYVAVGNKLLLLLSSLNFSVFDLQASYFREKCIDECTTASCFRNYQKNNGNQVKAKWRTCPVGGVAPVSPTLQSYKRYRTFYLTNNMCACVVIA